MKTRLQVSGSGGARNYKSLGIGGTIGVIAKEEGALAFWKGIGPAWMREASYTSLRLGLYGPLKSAFGVHKDSHFLMKFAVGSLAGAIGSIAGNPFDVLKTRMMTAEGKAPPSMRAAATDLYVNRGLAGFYRGLEVRILRASSLSCSNHRSLALATRLTSRTCRCFHGGLFRLSGPLCVCFQLLSVARPWHPCRPTSCAPWF